MVSYRDTRSLIPIRGCVAGRRTYDGSVDRAEDLVRRLAFNDERALSMVLSRRVGGDDETNLSPKDELLAQLAALLAVGAPEPSLRETVHAASAEGATPGEMVGVLVAVGPAVGVGCLVASAHRLATAIGYDLEDGLG
jgi:alkylhydroperoxidase/carboxymuconolactone decarboxylase family protein YurZ